MVDIFVAGPSIVMYHVLPSALAALVYLLFAYFFILLFRIKSSAARMVMYFLALYKSALLLFNGARYSSTIVPRKAFGFGHSFYDPLDLIPGRGGLLPDVKVAYEIMQSPWFISTISILVIIIILLLILRWFSMAWFLRNIVQREQGAAKLQKTAKRLSLVFNIKEPRIIVSSEDVGPMTIGVLKPVIIIPKEQVESFTESEHEVILGHEIAHIKRYDNLWQWISLFLKDMLFFSPFSRFTYKALQLNKEVAADNLFLTKFPKTRKTLANTITKVSDQANTRKGAQDVLVPKANFANIDVIKGRLKAIDKKPIKRKRNLVMKISTSMGLFTFFWFKIWIAIKAGDQALMLLS